jgi:integrase
MAKVGLEDVTPHSLRHTLATRAAEAGMSIWDMMIHFGWKDARQARTYVHLAGEGVPAMAGLTADLWANNP